MPETDRVLDILSEAKKLAREYKELTGKPLGITGEVAEYEAARILKLQLAVARQEGYDATEDSGSSIRKLQIKGRCVDISNKSQRTGSININKEWDAVLLVLLDENLDAQAIFEAPKNHVMAAIKAPGSKARNERHSLSISQFKRIAALRWQR